MTESIYETQPVARSATAGIQDGQVYIRPLGQIPSFLRCAQQALLQGDRERLAQQLEPRTLAAFEERWTQTPERVDQALMIIRLLQQLGRTEEALSWCQRIEGIEPGGFLYWQMSELLMQCPARLSEARKLAQRAVEAEPENHFYLTHLARLECRTGYLEQGLQRLERALQSEPDDPALLSTWLWFQHYSPNANRPLLFQGYRRFSQVMPKVPALPPVSRHIDPERALRIGFLSPDFQGTSSVMTFEPVLEGLREADLEVYAYANVAQIDEVTERLSEKVDHCQHIWGEPPRSVAERIASDGIDILVAWGGAVKNHCLAVLEHRPAPIQVDYGSIDTTGMAQIDYRLTDDRLDPPEMPWDGVERLVYLEGGMVCFRPPDKSPLVGPLPALRNGLVTFGAFNNHMKISRVTLEMWCRILRDLPQARLIVKFLQGEDTEIRSRYIHQLEALGAPMDRIEICPPKMSYMEHLDLYNDIDLTLDTYPFNGAITSFESLWMGVPVISRVGETFVARAGLNLMSRVGLEVFCAHSQEEYVGKACAFAGQIDALAALRPSLRNCLFQSSLCDPRRIGRALEQAFRNLWRQWCSQQPSRTMA